MKSLYKSLSLAILLAGCATGPKYQNYQAKDAACIHGDVANFFKFFSDGEAHVHIKEIDGVPTDRGDPYYFPAGTHKLGVSAASESQMAQDYVDLQFEAGRKYVLRANLRGISFAFQLLDVTEKPETTVAEFKMKVGSANQPIAIPIFVPIKR